MKRSTIRLRLALCRELHELYDKWMGMTDEELFDEAQKTTTDNLLYESDFTTLTIRDERTFTFGNAKRAACMKRLVTNHVEKMVYDSEESHPGAAIITGERR